MEAKSKNKIKSKAGMWMSQLSNRRTGIVRRVHCGKNLMKILQKCKQVKRTKKIWWDTTNQQDWKTNTNNRERPTGSSGGNAIITDQHKPQLWKRTLLTGAVATKNETTASNTLEGAGEINTMTFSAFLSSSTLLISCWGTHNPNPTPQARGQRSPDHAVHRGQSPHGKTEARGEWP